MSKELLHRVLSTQVQSASGMSGTSRIGAMARTAARPGLLLIGVIWLAVNLWALPYYPTPHVDEAWIASVSVEFLREGRFGLPIFTDTFGSSVNYPTLGRIYLTALAFFYAMFGVDIWQGRLFSLVGVVAGGWLLLKLAERLYGKSVGIAAAGIYMGSWRVFYAGHLNRPETWVIASSIGCVLAFLYLVQSPSGKRAFALGLLAALIVDVHFTALYTSLIVSGALVWQCRKIKNWACIGWYGTGVFVGAAYWTISHLLPDPLVAYRQSYSLIAGYRLGVSSEEIPFALASIPSLLQASLGYTRLSPVEFLFVSLAMLGLLWRRSPTDTAVMLWAVLLISSYILIAPGKGTHHLVLLSPLGALVVAGGLQAFLDKLANQLVIPGRQALLWLVVVSLWAIYLGGDSLLVWRNRDITYEAYASRLRKLVPLHRHIFGESAWYFAFHKYHYTLDQNLFYNEWVFDSSTHYQADEILRMIIRERGINVILLDERVSDNWPDASLTDADLAIRRYTAENCQPIGSVSGVMYGAEWVGGPAIKTTVVYECP